MLNSELEDRSQKTEDGRRINNYGKYLDNLRTLREEMIYRKGGKVKTQRSQSRNTALAVKYL